MSRAVAPPGLAALLAATPARLAIGRAGPRLRARSYLRFLADHARAREAVMSEVPRSFVRALGLVEIGTRAATRAEYLAIPELGRTLAPAAVVRLQRCRRRPDVQLAITDGLSSTAVLENGAALLSGLGRRLRARGDRLGTLLFIRNGRVRVQDEIGAIIHPEIFCLLVGERPGLATAESLSAYVIFRPTRCSAEPDRTVISNIHCAGLSPQRAVRAIVDLIAEMQAYGASGTTLAEARSAAERGRPGDGTRNRRTEARAADHQPHR